MKTLKIKTTGLSLNELYKKYGVGSKGFWSNDPWWKNEEFANEKPEPGEYEIVIEKELTNKTYQEQAQSLKNGWEFPHPAILAEVILFHFEKTGERVLENWYSITSSFDSDGHRVHVGSFDAKGLFVSYWYVNDRYDNLGVSSARKLSSIKPRILETFEPLTLPETLIINGVEYEEK